MKLPRMSASHPIHPTTTAPATAYPAGSPLASTTMQPQRGPLRATHHESEYDCGEGFQIFKTGAFQHESEPFRAEKEEEEAENCGKCFEERCSRESAADCGHCCELS